MGHRLAGVVERWMPSPFLFAIILSYVVFVAGVAVGDAHTNLLNPFWALPLLAITGVKGREMFGYAVAMLLLLIPFLGVALYAVPY